MKKQILFCALALVLMISECFAGPGFRDRPGDLKERFVILRNWELLQAFDLSEKEAQKVFEILKKYDDDRVELINKRRQLLKGLREDVDRSSSPDARLSELMQDLTDTNVELAGLPKRQLEGLGEVFNIRDQARFLLFSEKFAGQVRMLIAGERHKRGKSVPVSGPKQ
ncbi:MAG: hypothetical protein U9Q89_08865 [Thermodesulfobacteriota bacterium]|nr:hypothetical protein [Thermodesulfobacteriota bacterium]